MRERCGIDRFCRRKKKDKTEVKTLVRERPMRRRKWRRRRWEKRSQCLKLDINDRLEV